eukprot:GHUV01041738.1.p1 GENE.GHUV01041738.1~~GHUV01041738.1.p1  ORF type:complete len:139 (-),score=29.54 GHUV01041738.1:256-672(-)
MMSFTPGRTRSVAMIINSSPAVPCPQVWMGAFESALQASSRTADNDDQPAAGPSSSSKAADGAAARAVLERALKSLPKHKHIKALTRYSSLRMLARTLGIYPGHISHQGYCCWSLVTVGYCVICTSLAHVILGRCHCI